MFVYNQSINKKKFKLRIKNLVEKNKGTIWFPLKALTLKKLGLSALHSLGF